MSFSPELFTELARQERRSEEFIDACLQYARVLEEKNLPVIFSTAHLGVILGINDLQVIIRNRNFNYKFYQIRKKNGGVRQIVAPHSELKNIQRYIQTAILSKVEFESPATGFVAGKSIHSNALPHAGAQAILNVDLSKFFDSINERRVYGIFRGIGYATNLAVDLAKICTVELPEEYFTSFTPDELNAYKRLVKPGEAVLPQGAPTSPALSNLVLRRLDRRLNGLAKIHKIQYTRYADDITFSGSLTDLPMLKLLRHIIKSENININWNKVKVAKKGRRQMVTGLTISDGIHVPRSLKKEIRKHIYCCTKFGVEAHLKYIKMSGKKFYKEWLLGKIFYVNAVEPDAAEKLLNEFNLIDWPL